MGTQRLVGLVTALLLVVGGIYFLKSKSNTQPTLRVCTWSNYFPESSIKTFTAKTGIKVELSYISSNEELFAKLKAGATGFDIIQPSDYMIKQMTQLDMLKAVDPTKIPNLSNLEDFYKALPYDPGLKFSIPFTWGTTGIAINTEKVKVPEGGVGWNILLHSPDPEHTSILDDMREVFSAVLISTNEDPNTKDLNKLAKAKEQILKLKSKVLLFTSEAKPLLLNGELNVAHIYSTDAIQATVQNPKIQYFIPKEGGIVWTDNFAIPKSSPNSDNAHTFINYFLDPENAADLFTQNHLATTSRTLKEKLPDSEKNNPQIYPSREVMSKMHFLEDLGDTLLMMNRLWTELKS